MNKPLSILALIALTGAIFGFQKQLAPSSQVKQLTALANVRSLALAVKTYASDYDGVMPAPQNLYTLKVVTLPYVKDKEFWKTANEKSEIRFNFSLSGVRLASVKDPNKVVMFYESKPWADGRRAVSFADGSGSILDAHDWAHSAATLSNTYKKVASPLPLSIGRQWKN